MISSYYQESVDLGQQFQKQNKSWDGRDSVMYQRQIKDVIDLHECKTLLDYGCGKGAQWTVPARFFHSTNNEKQICMFQDYLNITSIYKYDPCVPEFDSAPEKKQKFDIVMCTQVLTYIPDKDLSWVKQLLMNHTGKACFIGLHSITPKSKKQIYNPEFFSESRTEEWYKNQFSDWTGSKLYWWFRGKPYTPDWINK